MPRFTVPYSHFPLVWAKDIGHLRRGDTRLTYLSSLLHVLSHFVMMVYYCNSAPREKGAPSPMRPAAGRQITPTNV